MRRQGIASRLMEELIDWANRINIKSLSVRVDADNESAINLYAKFGFEKERGDIVMERQPVEGK